MDDEGRADRLALDREARWRAHYAGRTFSAPVPTWWPWPVTEVCRGDGDPDTGMITMMIEPEYAPEQRPLAMLVRQPAGEPPYDLGWPALAWKPEIDPETQVSAHQWDEDEWRWTIFVCDPPFSQEEVDRIRASIEWHTFSGPPL